MKRVSGEKGKECAGKSVPLFVYRYSIIERGKKGRCKDSVGVPTLEHMFIIYRYIERSYKHKGVLSANIRSI